MKKIAIKKIKIKFYGEKTWKVDVKYYNGMHENWERKRKKKLIITKLLGIKVYMLHGEVAFAVVN